MFIESVPFNPYRAWYARPYDAPNQGGFVDEDCNWALAIGIPSHMIEHHPPGGKKAKVDS